MPSTNRLNATPHRRRKKNNAMEDRKLDAQQSFELINRMIENTRSRMERNAGLPFLVWGYATVVFALGVWGLVLHTGDPRWNWLWLALPVVGGIGMYLTHRDKQEGRVHTFVDRVINHIWLVLGLTACFMTLLTMTGVARLPMLFIIVLLMGIGTSVTGLVIRFAPAVAGGFVGIVVAPLLFVTTGGLWSPLLFIAAFVAMMIVPGHILNYRSNHPSKQ